MPRKKKAPAPEPSQVYRVDHDAFCLDVEDIVDELLDDDPFAAVDLFIGGASVPIRVTVHPKYQPKGIQQ
jgi:hypothetical protein